MIKKKSFNKPRALYKADFGIEYTKRSNISLLERDQHTVPQTGERISETLEKIIKHTKDIKTVLEVGCGLGHNLELLKKFGDFDLTGVDIQKYALSEARKKYKNINFIEADCSSLPFEESSFDLVFTRMTLIHIPPDEIDLILKELSRVSFKYMAAIEYFSKNVEEINWRGEEGVIWKMDYHDSCNKHISHNFNTIFCDYSKINYDVYNQSNLSYQHFLIELNKT